MAPRAALASALALSLAALMCCSAPAPTQAQPYATQMRLAQAAIGRQAGYTLFTKNLKNITALTATYSKQNGNKPVTIFAPNDAAVTKILSVIQPTKAAITQVVQYHILQGVKPIAFLKSLKMGTPLPTFAPGKSMLKASPKNSPVLKFKSPRSPAPLTVTKSIYVGSLIAVYGVDKVLLS